MPRSHPKKYSPEVIRQSRLYSPGTDTAVSKLWRCRDTECLIEGPAGTGKTRGSLEKIYACAIKFPRSRHLICRKTRESMTQTILVTFEEKVVPEGDPCLAGANRNNRSSYTLANGSEIVLGGMNKPERIMSGEFDTIFAPEGTEFTLNDHEMLLSRLRNGVMPFQQIIVDCNPGPPTHWLNQRANAGMMTRFLSRHEHNPTLYRDGDWTDAGRTYISTLDRLTGHRLARLRHGKWVAASGLVYDCFDAAVHMKESTNIPPHWRRIVSIDFGFNNPFVAQWWAIDGDGNMIRYREIYMSKRTVRVHAEQIRKLSAGERIEAYVCDHDAEDRATLEENGIPTIPAKKEIKPGIEAVVARMTASPKPRLYLMRDALVERDEDLHAAGKPCSTDEEMDCYRWPVGIDGKAQRETPVDEDNHGCDAVRYAERYISRGAPVIVVPDTIVKPMDEIPSDRSDRDDARCRDDNW